MNDYIKSPGPTAREIFNRDFIEREALSENSEAFEEPWAQPRSVFYAWMPYELQMSLREMIDFLKVERVKGIRDPEQIKIYSSDEYWLNWTPALLAHDAQQAMISRRLKLSHKSSSSASERPMKDKASSTTEINNEESSA